MIEQKVKDQIIYIQQTGLTNMFDVVRVLELANDFEFTELVNFITHYTTLYAEFILHGDTSN